MKCFCPAGIAFLKTLGYNLTERVKNSPLIKKGDFENESNIVAAEKEDIDKLMSFMING